MGMWLVYQGLSWPVRASMGTIFELSSYNVLFRPMFDCVGVFEFVLVLNVEVHIYI